MLARETKILLGLLGTLSSGFIGVLGTKLLVPRPPEGAGPDVHVAAEDFERTAIVDPPSFDGPPTSAFGSGASAESAWAQLPAAGSSAFTSAADDVASDVDSVASDETAGQLPPPPKFWSGDDEAAVVTADDRAADDRAAESFDDLADADTDGTNDRPIAPPAFGDSGDGRFAAATDVSAGLAEPTTIGASEIETTEPAPFARPQMFQPPSDASPITQGEHVVVAGDTWWSVAERAYGDGRLFKPLYAWNRRVNPAVAMTAGTRLQVPPIEQLAAAQAALMPAAADVSSASASAVRTVSASEPLDATAVGRSIVVAPGDTLISIARDHLGSAARWREVFDANRDTLGRSPGPLTPGTRLMLP
jgi:nucleoid-associated protein YgaU